MRIGALAIVLLGASVSAACAAGNRRTSDTGTNGGQQGPAQALTPAQIAARSTPAIVTVRTPNGMGTGFVIRADGWIVTNLHVVVGSKEVAVTLPNKKTYPVVEVLNANPRHDLVLLRIEADKLPTLELGQSDSVRPGDPVVAIGHPLGLEDTVSNGLVSAIRELDELTVLQISAPIAPGSSGGPLFNDRGEVIGVATAILRGGQNLNLGLPAKYVQELLYNPEPVSLARFAEFVAELQRQNAPKERQVPELPASTFAGCNDVAVDLVRQGIAEAVEVGAALFNQGNAQACYHMYDGAAADLERRLPKGCKGPKRALSEGRARASKLDDPRAQAWAMRDVFDGLIDAMARKAAGKP